ncbi:MAG: 1-(5-phosphoribosyl)-5-amino-4-imidazole-carboxylate carboxylase [Armatimonadota bacterium]|nr:MAG: 1-(5-phosphoribosyl)-5-amino-4-imidazole-carboxylate carboxylase [Armatimonadota bacterium]
MDTESLKSLLRSVREGSVEVEDAVQRLRTLPFEDLGFARVDHHRPLRQGIPEVVFCQGKTPDQAARIFQKLAEQSENVLATRASEEHFHRVQELVPEAQWHPEARIIRLMRRVIDDRGDRYVAVLSAGTSDIPVAEEAAVTAETLGSSVQRAYDVGVAGLHRLLDCQEMIYGARALVVVAGMEGALPSVVGGLVSRPVIAVPTSVGYGASFQGLAALLAMLNCCASGVAVVNIDNGFGAGYLAHLIANGDSL